VRRLFRENFGEKGGGKILDERGELTISQR